MLTGRADDIVEWVSTIDSWPKATVCIVLIVGATAAAIAFFKYM